MSESDRRAKATKALRPAGPLVNALSPTAAQQPGRATATLAASGQSIEQFAGRRIEQYELIRELGRGGMGQVFLARDAKLGRLVALKFLTSSAAEDSAAMLAEARATARCNHENIIVIHQVNEHAGTPYMVLEYLQGESLAEMVRAGSLPARRAVELVVPVVRALVRAHEFQIVHRDLKPDNIFVTSSGTVKVLDFGIAKMLASAKAPRLGGPTDTMEGVIIGTPLYMSPEQLTTEDIDHRSDIWAIGVILFELLTGQPPNLHFTLNERIARAISKTPMPELREAAPHVSVELAAIVDKCLRHAKDERYADAAALLADLERHLPMRSGRRLAEGETPYPGLLAFQEADAHRFFGRSTETSKFVARLNEQPFLAVVGPSGAGKSSFVRAGVIPELKERGPWDARVIRPGRRPMNALAQLLRDIGATGDDDLVAQPGAFGEGLRTAARTSGRRVLVLVDQLEEIYTLSDEGQRHAFTACLAGAADDASSPVRVVASIRSDFLDRAAEDPLFVDQLARGLFFLRPPSRTALREALTEPAEMLGYSYESPELLDRMLDSLAGTQGALPLLQFAASRMWENRDRERKIIGKAAYDAIGGISGALATHADEILEQRPAATQRLARGVFQRLVTPERTRDVVDITELEELGDSGEVRRLVDQLIAARLLVVQNRGDADAPAVELVHESMIASWPTLRRWLDESEEDAAILSDLRMAAKQWDAHGRTRDTLWRGDALDKASRWRTRYRGTIPARERDYLDAATALANRTVRIRRFAIIGSFSFLIGLVVLGAVALVSIRSAEQQAIKAKHAATESEKEAKQEASNARAAERRADARLEELQREQQAKAEAERRATEASTKVVEGEQALQLSYSQLEEALAEAKGERRRAEKAAATARKAAEDLTKANAELARKYREEQRRRREAQQAAKEISTKLK